MEKVDRITVDRCNNMAARVNECKRHWQESCSRCRYFGCDCHGTFDLLHHIEIDYKVMIRQLKESEAEAQLPKLGEWINSKERMRPDMCSVCGCVYEADRFMDKIAWNYCPNCGAKMEVQE